MSLAGQGVLGLWFDIAPEQLDEFFEWHNREHMPERLGNAGFRSGRRFGAVDAPNQFFVLYETSSSNVPAGPEYLNRVRYRTPWSNRMSLLNCSRSVFHVLLSLGSGQGGTMMSLRYSVSDGKDEEQRRLISHRVLPQLVDEPGIAGCHVCRVDRHAMGIADAEKVDFRSAADNGDTRDWLVLVEGSRDAAAVSKACHEPLSDGTLTAAGAIGPIERGLYQLQHSLFRIA
jgi:hypothetical protein